MLRLRNLLALRKVFAEEGADADVALMAVNTDEEARRLPFPGSPTIRVRPRPVPRRSPKPERAGAWLPGVRELQGPKGLPRPRCCVVRSVWPVRAGKRDSDYGQVRLPSLETDSVARYMTRRARALIVVPALSPGDSPTLLLPRFMPRFVLRPAPRAARRDPRRSSPRGRPAEESRGP